MSDTLSASAQRIQETLHSFGLTCEVVKMGQTTRSAQDAARAVGCVVGQIAKSLVFRGSKTNQPVLVVTSGANRVNEKSIGQMISEPLVKADAEFVRAKTGFAIGGVPPVGHLGPLTVFIDQDLFQYPHIWAAAGTPHAVFKLSPAELQRITGGRVICVK